MSITMVAGAVPLFWAIALVFSLLFGNRAGSTSTLEKPRPNRISWGVLAPLVALTPATGISITTPSAAKSASGRIRIRFMDTLLITRSVRTAYK